MTLGEFLAYAGRHPLARRNRLRAGWNIARWQLRSRLASGGVRVPWIEGSVLMARRGMTGATGNIYYGLHECADMGFLLHLLRAGDLFVDVGANVGSYTVLAAKVRGSAVIAFEPDPGTHSFLMDNIAANGIGGQVTVLQKAVGAEEGEIRFSVGLDTMNRVLGPGEADAPGQERVLPITMLDTVLAGRDPVMLKIDVEGHEPAVMQGAAATLANPSLLAVEIETVDASVRNALHAAGFREYGYDPFTRVCTAAQAQASGHNSLFIRDIDAVCARLKAAAPVRVHGQTL